MHVRLCSQWCFFVLFISLFLGPHLSIVILLPFVSEHGANDISRVFNDHLSWINGFLAEQTSAMNGRPAEGYRFQN